MMYFFYLQTPFTGGEDGIQSVPRGTLFGMIDLTHDLTMYFFVLAVFVAGSCSSTASSTRRSARC